MLIKYHLFQYSESWFSNSTSLTYTDWKRIIRLGIQVFENDAWSRFCYSHPDMHVAQTCFENMSTQQFWSIADEYPDLVTRSNVQARLVGNFGLNGSVPWLKDTEGTLCFSSKEDIENTDHFLLDCSQFKEKFDSVWRNLHLKTIRSNPTDGIQIASFIKVLDRQRTR